MTALLGLFNFLAFEAAWFVAVTGGARGWPWTGSLAVLGVVLIHLMLKRNVAGREIALILAVTLIGGLIETLFVATGLIRYAGMAPGQLLPPIWIWALWFGFGTLPSASLAWLRGRWLLQALLGLVFGPITYWAGARMGAASLPPEGAGAALLAIGIAWALVLPAIFLVAEALSGTRPKPALR